MLKVTPNAATALVNARDEAGAPETHGVRFFAEQQEGQAPRLAIGFAAEPGPKDTVAEQEGIKTFLAPEVADVLTDVTLDARPANGQQELVLLRADEKGEDSAKG